MSDDEYTVEESTADVDDSMRAFLPASFGKQSKIANVAGQIEQSKRAEDESHQSSLNLDRDSKDDDSDDYSDDEVQYPVSHELLLQTHERAVTSVSIDPSGARLATGSTDCTIKLHDFASMTPTTLRAFKSVEPTTSKSSEAHAVHNVVFNPLSAGHLLAVSAVPQAKVLSRDGETLTEFVKGDMYLRDMHNTKGHISEITSGTWSPTERHLCVTAGTDSTLRIWDVNFKRSQKEVIVHKSRIAGSGGRTRMTAVVWGSRAQGGDDILVAAALDGSLAFWNGAGPHTRPAAEIRDAHTKDTWTSGVDISADGRMVVTRGGDSTIKLWDTRKFKTAVTTVSHPSTSSQYPTTNIRFSPTSSSIITGSETGHLHILNPATLRPELVTLITPNSPLITVLWHEKLNQIVTGSANAKTHVLYNPSISTKGATVVMSKAPKRRHIDDDPSATTDVSQGISDDAIVNPNGLLTGSNQASTSYAARHPTVGLTASGRSRDPRRPHIPAVTPFGKTQPDERHIAEHIPLSSMRDEDPREALLKYAEKAEKDPLFTNAWKHTQPKTLYADLSDDEAEAPEKKKARY